MKKLKTYIHDRMPRPLYIQFSTVHLLDVRKSRWRPCVWAPKGDVPRCEGGVHLGAPEVKMSGGCSRVALGGIW